MEKCHFIPTGPSLCVCDVCGMPEEMPEGISVERVCLGVKKREQLILTIPFRVSLPSPLVYHCRHRGQIHDLIECKPCEAEGRELSVWGCSIHGECVIHNSRKRKPDGTRWQACSTCADRQEPDLTPPPLEP